MAVLDDLPALASYWVPATVRQIDSWTGCLAHPEWQDCRTWHWAVDHATSDPIAALCVLATWAAFKQYGAQAWQRFLIWLEQQQLDTRSSRFIRAWEAYRAGYFGGSGFYLGDFWGRRGRLVRSIRVPGVASIMTFGGAGRRKGSGILIPNVISPNFPVQVCIDFSGEIAATTKAPLERRGYEVKCISPYGLHTDAPQSLTMDRLNPLIGIDPFSRRFSSQCRARAEACVIRSGKESEPHWTNSTVGFIDFRIRQEIKAAHAEGREPSFINVIQSLTGDVAALIEDFRVMTECDDKFIAAAGAGMLARALRGPKEFESVRSHISANVAWVQDHAMEASMSGHDIDYDKLAGKKKCKGYVVFIILPLELAESHAAWLKLCLQAIISEMIRRRPKHRILITVDETAVLGGWLVLKHALANLRKFKLQFHLVYHSLGEIKELFGESSHSMMANCFVKNFVGVNDSFTAQELSDMLGERATINVETGKVDREKLARPEDILQCGEQVQISLIGAGRPVLIHNRPYFHRPTMRRGLTQNPYYTKDEYPDIPSPYPVWFCLGLLVTAWSMTRPRASELSLGALILGVLTWAIYPH